MSSHRLEIESGRWTRPNSTPLDDRKCNLCNILEDEFHFVLECNMFVELRKKFCQAFSRLRMSSHRLEIESGRWTRPNSTPLDDRKCNLCNILEDEFHFVLECNMFVELRKKYISRYYWNRPSMHKFIF